MRPIPKTPSRARDNASLPACSAFASARLGAQICTSFSAPVLRSNFRIRNLWFPLASRDFLFHVLSTLTFRRAGAILVAVLSDFSNARAPILVASSGVLPKLLDKSVHLRP